MADDPNQIGQVSVGVVAKGVEETNKKLDSVAQHAKAAQAAVNGTGGNGYEAYVRGAIAGGTPFDKIKNEQRFLADQKGPADDGGPLDPKKANKAEQAFGGLGQELRNIFRIVSGLTIGATIVGKLVEGFIGWKNAARDVSNELRDISEGFKVNASVGQSSFDTLAESSEEYHKKEKRKLDEEAGTWGEYFQKLIEQRLDFVLAADGESKLLSNKRKQEAASELADNQRIITHEMNASELRVRNLDREIALSKAATTTEKVNLQEKFDLEDEQRARARAMKASESEKDEKVRAKAQAAIDAQGDAEDAKIKERAEVRRRITQREEAEAIRRFQGSAAQSAASRFGPGNSDLTILTLRNILGAVRAYGQNSRQF